MLKEFALFALRGLVVMLTMLHSAVLAEHRVINGPSGSVRFGAQVVHLDNGNIVITDPGFQAISNQSGAVYLYRSDGTQISRLTNTPHQVAMGQQVMVLPSGNFLVRSSNWGSNTRGAVTWCSGALGCNGEVSAANSLVGGQNEDRVGEEVVLLKNSNYLVLSPKWNHGAQNDVGAATWGNGTVGVAGLISASNSLLGSSPGDQVGVGGAVALNDGRFVVRSSQWSERQAPFRQGALTRGTGVTPLTGGVSAANSFLGSAAVNGDSDNFFYGSVIELEGGNVLVADPSWNDGPFPDVGAVTWFGAGDALVGSATVFNSLTGTNSNDRVGSNIAVLQGGQYAVGSEFWRAGRGAVTLSVGASRLTGRVSATNSLVGSAPGDHVGEGLTVLSNGNLVVTSPKWGGSFGEQFGAVSFISAAAPLVGPISTANSLYSVESSFFEPAFRVTPLRNGNFVISCADCTIGGRREAGVVVFASGAMGITGPITTTNSLHGVRDFDFVGREVLALSDGNYVVLSPDASRNTLQNVGAATFGDGQTGIQGAISPTNSLIGSAQFDRVGSYGLVMEDGAYLVASPSWANGAAANAGAVTYLSPQSRTVGEVSASNSLVGTRTDDQVANNGILQIAPRRVAISSTVWSSATATGAGAVTLVDAFTGLTGPVSVANSLVGSRQNDQVGYGFSAEPDLTRRVLSTGKLLVLSPRYSSTAPSRSGAATLLQARAGQADQSGELTTQNSVFGHREPLAVDLNPLHDELLVGIPDQNRVIFFRTDALFRSGFEP